MCFVSTESRNSLRESRIGIAIQCTFAALIGLCLPAHFLGTTLNFKSTVMAIPSEDRTGTAVSVILHCTSGGNKVEIAREDDIKFNTKSTFWLCKVSV